MSKKHEVLKTFRDKLTGDIVIAGSFFEANDNNRLEDMFNRGLLKEDKEQQEKEQQEKEQQEKEQQEKEQQEKEEQEKETKEQPFKKANTRKKSGE